MLDVYRQNFGLLLPDGYHQYRSFIGAILSVMTLVTITLYATFQVEQLINLENYKVQLHTLENEYATNATFGAANGFAVAAAVTSFDGSSVDITDPEIGEIKFYLKHWDVEKPENSVYFEELENRICTEQDFNDVDDSNSDVSNFYPLNKVSKPDLDSYGAGKMRCIKNLDDLKMWGNFDSNTASNLMIVFEKCDIGKRPPGAKCKGEREIEEWMQFKYIATLENEAKFI